ncbi:MAG: hypothetical protein D6782_12325 [Alphaproteobacteria bacterium]|nr:MAG: hypothetical protein D6782_12325 [Alphaproteobacteria bacterium]
MIRAAGSRPGRPGDRPAAVFARLRRFFACSFPSAGAWPRPGRAKAHAVRGLGQALQNAIIGSLNKEHKKNKDGFCRP